MGLFDFLKKGSNQPAKPVNNGPYKDAATNHIYELLFCDNPALYKQNLTSPYAYPYDNLLGENTSAEALQQVANDDTLDTRLKLLAYHQLRQTGITIPGKLILGVIVEVALDGGLDTLASFRDGTARYINQSGRMVIWENTSDPEMNAITSDLFAKSEAVVHRIGPWDKPRLRHPAHGKTRLSFLVSDGLYFGEGVTNSFFNDELAAPALMAATRLMQYLTKQSLKDSK